GLAIVGILAFIIGGRLDKWNVIIGPFFLIGSLLSVLRQRDLLNIEVEVPILLIVFGVLLFVAQLPAIPLPSWYTPPISRQ
ncbi:MAG TPA: hypothetical protein VGI75_03475, partial [Pirellulales bacterium]